MGGCGHIPHNLISGFLLPLKLNLNLITEREARQVIESQCRFCIYVYIYTLLHELECNMARYFTSVRYIFTSRRRVKI